MTQEKSEVSLAARYARVYLLDAPYAIDRPFDYFIPTHLRERALPGTLALVPFGGGNRKQYAIITECLQTIPQQLENRIKPIDSLLYEGFALNGEFLQLCAFLREYTLCTMGEAVRCVLPPAAFGQLRQMVSVTDHPPAQDIPEQALLLWNRLQKSGPMTQSRLQSLFGEKTDLLLVELEKRHMISRDVEYLESITPHKHIYDCTLSEDEINALPAGRKGVTEKQRAVLLAALQTPGLKADELQKAAGITSAAPIKALLEKGYLASRAEAVFRDPYADIPLSPPDENCLSPHQKAACDAILELYRTGEPRAALLHGVTGSGKTRVIKAVMDQVMQSGRQVIMLVPEISLTPQTVSYFRSCYGSRVAVIHSALSAGERLDTYNRIKQGQVDLCIGTRSAVFAPFDRLGLIVLDEEQEHTYKSDSSPRYHARDVARFRCAHHKALMLLASATPSVESYYKAETGTYTLITLKERYGDAKLPIPQIVDLRAEEQTGNVSPFSARLQAELDANLQNGEQSILFLNRRGYHNFLSCPQCGAAVLCPHCSVSMTYHTARNAGSGYLSCHYCGLRQSVPDQCPECGGTHMHFLGYGTQLGEQALRERFPQARIARMDADTTTSKWAYFDILDRFRKQEFDILIGTQMVTKGHDFPNVTLSGVTNADTSLFLDDFRSNERTFSMIAQVLGRAGRADKPGRAVIQTYNPDHPVIRQAAAQDYVSFYRNEISLRHSLLFPPFCDIALITVISDDERVVNAAAAALDGFIGERQAKDYSDVVLQCFGPFEAPVYKVNGKFRMRMVIKCKSNKRTRALLRAVLNEFAQDLIRKLTVTVDINPSHL